jgi:hypothetical protein
MGILHRWAKKTLTPADYQRIKGAMDELTSQAATPLCRCCNGSTEPDYRANPMAQETQGVLDLMLVASIGCRTVDDVLKIRPYAHLHEHQEVGRTYHREVTVVSRKDRAHITPK